MVRGEEGMDRKPAFTEPQLQTWFELTLSSPAVWVLFHCGNINDRIETQSASHLQSHSSELGPI